MTAKYSGYAVHAKQIATPQDEANISGDQCTTSMASLRGPTLAVLTSYCFAARKKQRRKADLGYLPLFLSLC